MKIEIYKNEELLDLENIYVRENNFEIDDIKDNYKEYDVDFGYIKYLKGEKIILELAFQHEKKESLNN
jgi:hypothetical protein